MSNLNSVNLCCLSLADHLQFTPLVVYFYSYDCIIMIHSKCIIKITQPSIKKFNLINKLINMASK